MNYFKTETKFLSENDEAQFHQAVDFISDLLQIKPEMLAKKSRNKASVMARHSLAYYLRKHTEFPLEYIGAMMNKHHATIIHSIKFITDYSSYDPYIRMLKESIDNKFKPDHFSFRKEIMKCIKSQTTDSSKAENILTLFHQYAKKSLT